MNDIHDDEGRRGTSPPKASAAIDHALVYAVGPRIPGQALAQHQAAMRCGLDQSEKDDECGNDIHGDVE